MKFIKSNQLRKLSHTLIPGGAHTYSKGDDQFPYLSPGFIVKAKGAYCWDPDGNKFLDWGMGVRSVTLGHGYKPVVEAVKKQVELGSNYTRPSVLEIELAKLLHDIIPCAEMVKFAKNGSTATTAAVKLARAYTNRDLVAFCSDHPFFSYDDWFIGATQVNIGIPKAVKDLTVSFKFNNIESLEKLFKKYPRQIACVILEPATEIVPKDNFLKKVQKLCKKNGAVFILDEMISGFRWHLRGAQYVYGVKPDLATFGKGIANGFSVAVLAGKKEIMKLGGIYGKQKRVFLTSTTHGAENHSLLAAITAIKEMRRKNVIPHFYKIGRELKKRLNKINRKYGLEKIINVYGEADCRVAAAFNPFGKYNALQIKTYFFQEMISRGILFNGYFSISFAHREKEIALTERVWDFACHKLKSALDNKNLEKKLIGKPIKPVFRKNN